MSRRGGGLHGPLDQPERRRQVLLVDRLDVLRRGEEALVAAVRAGPHLDGEGGDAKGAVDPVIEVAVGRVKEIRPAAADVLHAVDGGDQRGHVAGQPEVVALVGVGSSM